MVLECTAVLSQIVIKDINRANTTLLPFLSAICGSSVLHISTRKMPSAYQPKVAIVTGSAQGIGHAIAHRLADDGISVVINDLPEKEEQCAEVVKEFEAKGQKAVAIVGAYGILVAISSMLATVRCLPLFCVFSLLHILFNFLSECSVLSDMGSVYLCDAIYTDCR